MMKETSPGDYQHELTLPLPGRWDVVLKIQQQDDHYEIRANTSISAE